MEVGEGNGEWGRAEGGGMRVLDFLEMSKTQMTWAMLAALTSLIGAMALIMLVSRDEVTFIMPNVQPLVLLIGAIIGYFIFF